MSISAPPIRVLLLAEYDATGGTRTFLLQLLRHYVDRKWRILLLAKGPRDDEEIQAFCHKARIEFRPYALTRAVARGGRFPLPILREMWAAGSILRDFKPDLVVASVGTPGLFLGHMPTDRPGLYILHTAPDRVQGMLRGALVRQMWRALAPASCTYLTVSRYAQAKLSESWGLDSRFDVEFVYNTAGASIDPHEFSVNAEVVLTVGHVVWYKNPLLWIEMARLVLEKRPEVRFEWVGPGPMLEECRSEVRRLGLGDRVVFHGASNDVPSFLRRCDVYVQPSSVESLGIAVLDAMRFGRPCVVSRVGGLPELVEDGVSGTIVDLASEARGFADAVVPLLGSSPTRLAMGRAAATRYESCFSPARWTRQITEAHERALARGGRPSDASPR